MSAFCTIQDGQITLPAELREELGLHDGDRIEFMRKDGDFVLITPGQKRPFDNYHSPFPIFKNFEESQEWAKFIRGRDEDDL